MTAPAIRVRELAGVVALALTVLVAGLGRFDLIDPWETHYGEVARAILERDDWVRLTWQGESFRSKPALGPWLIAAGLRAAGLAEGGGYSGELATHAAVAWAVRLPFALFGAFGLVATWLALARLTTRRLAWLVAVVLATSPFYALVARQALTDMPMLACAMGAIACFLVAFCDGERPARRAARLGLAAALAATCVLELWACAPVLGPSWLAGGAVATALVATLCGRARSAGQLAMYAAYALVGVSLLAKGPVAAAIVGLTCGLTVTATGRWRWLARARLPEGLLVMAVVAAPWHVAMALADGRPWLSEYFGQHWLARAGSGMHGDRGGFYYLVEQLGLGMFPWTGLVPLAIAAALRRGPVRTPADCVRFAALAWATAAIAFFTVVETKFHHYVLPAVPGLAILVAAWLDDVLDAGPRRLAIGLLAAVALTVLAGAALAADHSLLIELFVYRHDRPWPTGVALGPELWAFALATAVALAGLAVARARRGAAAALIAVALGFTLWAANRYMGAAAPHWGQRALHRTYHARRAIHGVELTYPTVADLAADWADRRVYPVRAVRPDGLAPGTPLAVALAAGGQTWSLRGRLERAGADTLWIAVDPAGLAGLPRGATGATGRPPRVRVDADLLIAWQLFWRGENFWSGGEIYGPTAATRTVFPSRDDQAFVRWINDPARVRGRRYFVATEAGRAEALRRLLPGEPARASLRVEDASSNKFTLLSFVLAAEPAAAPAGGAAPSR